MEKKRFSNIGSSIIIGNLADGTPYISFINDNKSVLFTVKEQEWVEE